MRICVDVSAAVHDRAGVGRYARELVAALVGLEGDCRFSIFYNDSSRVSTRESLAGPLKSLPSVTIERRDKSWRMGVLLSHAFSRSQDSLFPGIDLFHGTDHLLPKFTRIKSVFTLHDATFHLFPETHSALNRWFLSLMMPRFLESVHAVIADSESTRRDALRLFRIAPERISVVYSGVSKDFRPVSTPARSAVREKYGLPEAFILYVGTIEPRKNLETLVRAFRQVRGSLPHKLVIVGRKGWRYEGFFRLIEHEGLTEDILFTGFVPYEDLAAIYCCADLFVFPSLYEGFGFPVLEAMACGTPVVCSDRSSLPEVAGKAALLVDPANSVALAEALERALTDRQLRATLQHAGFLQAAGFTWERAARETMAIYRRAASDR